MSEKWKHRIYLTIAMALFLLASNLDYMGRFPQ